MECEKKVWCRTNCSGRGGAGLRRVGGRRCTLLWAADSCMLFACFACLCFNCCSWIKWQQPPSRLVLQLTPCCMVLYFCIFFSCTVGCESDTSFTPAQPLYSRRKTLQFLPAHGALLSIHLYASTQSMIIRQLAWRNGTRMSFRAKLHVQSANGTPQPPGRTWLRPNTFRAAQRFLSTDIDSTSTQDVHSIGSAFNGTSEGLNPPIESPSDAVKEDYDEYKRQST